MLGGCFTSIWVFLLVGSSLPQEDLLCTLKEEGVVSTKVEGQVCLVYSNAKPKKTQSQDGERPLTASVPWVPPVGGLIIAGKVVNDILEDDTNV